MYYIYQIYCSGNNKTYIGQTIQPHIRWNQHKNRLAKKTHDNAYLQNCYDKYGLSSLSFELIDALDTQQAANDRELFWIKAYRNVDLSLNLSGFTTVNTLSAESKHKISKSLEGNSYRKGIPHTDEVKDRIRKANSGKKFTREHLLKRSIANGFKPVKVYHPDHGIVTIEYIKEFCDKYGLYNSGVSYLISGRYKSTQGWTLYREE